MILPVILSGGSGTRLWPLSRELHPKQFLPLIDEHSLLQNTVERVVELPAVATPLLICNQEHRFMAAEQLRALGIDSASIILEPCGRNTAPAVAVAALASRRKGEDPLLLVLPSDHVLSDSEAFRQAVDAAVPLAQAGRLITFGVRPLTPETGYGYIKSGQNIDGGEAAEVDSFVEKPDLETATDYVASKKYYWNSGMFLFQASAYLDELERFAPEILKASRLALEKAKEDLDFIRLDPEAFAASPAISIDYAVMEHTRRAAVVPMDAGWSDVGSWAALWGAGNQCPEGNVTRGDVVVHAVKNSYLHSESRLLAALGVEGLVVVETPDAVLVAAKSAVQDVKSVVSGLNAQKRPEGRIHRKVYRPWGDYDSVDAADRFQVKRITVKPGARLSLQMHHHRAEHWIVVKGTARVTRDEEEFLISENQSAYIPLGARHRLENPGTIPLEVIEVQSGSYLGEDDIVRFEDVYGREEETS